MGANAKTPYRVIRKLTDEERDRVFQAFLNLQEQKENENRQRALSVEGKSLEERQ